MIVFLFIFLLIGVSSYYWSVSAKKNPYSLIKGTISLYKKNLAPEAVKQYANRMSGFYRLLGIFYIVFAFVQYWIGSCDLSIVVMVISLIVICAYTFYYRKILTGKVSVLPIVFMTLFCIGVYARIGYSYIEASVIVENERIRITGSYGEKIPLNQLNAVFLADTLPGIGLRTNGISTGAIRKGYFTSKSLKRNVKLLLHSKTKPYIYINYANNRYVIVNFKKKEKILQVYEQIKGLVENE